MGIVKDAEKPKEVSSEIYESEDENDIDDITIDYEIAEEVKQPQVVVTPQHQNKPTKQFFNPDLFN